jgi:hypothetical protein
MLSCTIGIADLCLLLVQPASKQDCTLLIRLWAKHADPRPDAPEAAAGEANNTGTNSATYSSGQTTATTTEQAQDAQEPFAPGKNDDSTSVATNLQHGQGAVEGGTGQSTAPITTSQQDKNILPSERVNIDMQVEQVDQVAQNAVRVEPTDADFSNKLFDVHMIQVPQDNAGLLDEPMLHVEEGVDNENRIANKDSRRSKTCSAVTGTPLMCTQQYTQELEETTTQSQDITAPIGPLATAIASRNADLPTSACPMLCALRLLRFVSWTLQDRSGAIDYQLLCAVAHGAIQRDPSLKKDILHLYTEMSEEVAAAILEGKPIPYLACVEICNKQAE